MKRSGKSRRDGMKPHPPTPLSTGEGAQSRRDGTLLTVGFNLRTRSALRSPQSPAGTAFLRSIVPSLRVGCKGFGSFLKNICSFFRECPDGQARILSYCFSIDMNVLMDKMVLATWVLMTTISRREKISIESNTQKASVVRRTFTKIRKGSEHIFALLPHFLHPTLRDFEGIRSSIQPSNHLIIKL